MLNVHSFGRARSLTVLAQEELGKALWVYDAFEGAWSAGDDSPRLVDPLASHGRSHTRKYSWRPSYSAMDLRPSGATRPTLRTGRERASRGRRGQDVVVPRRRRPRVRQTMQGSVGLYVDREDDGTISSPTQLEVGSIPEDLRKAAQVVEMLLIQDHSRMKHGAVTPYDGTHPQQFRLLPISHPELWQSASDDFKMGGGDSALGPAKD